MEVLSVRLSDCDAVDSAGAINHINELPEHSKLDTVKCLCETVCSLIVSTDPADLDRPFVDLLLDVAPADINMLGAAI